MSLRGALLSFRVQRFETTIIIGATVLAVLVSAIVIALFNAGGYARCQADDPSVFGSLCFTGAYPWLSRIARLSVALVPLFPVIAGLLAGGPIVAKELETGTARLAWSLGPSRLRWLALRAVPILAMVVVAALAIGLTADALLHLLNPSLDVDQSFAGFRGRGLLVGVEAFLVASIALAFGSILGRAVPTLVLSLILVGGLGVAVDKVERDLLTNEAVVEPAMTYQYTEANLVVGNRLRMTDGSILTWEQAFATHPELQNGWDETAGGPQSVVLYVPGSRYHDVERREALALLVIAAGFAALATLAVVRRRPR
jgi:hypothetical protein